VDEKIQLVDWISITPPSEELLQPRLLLLVATPWCSTPQIYALLLLAISSKNLEE